MRRNKLISLIKPLYLLIWLAVSMYVGMHHEPFADEAQSYLIARDVSVKELIASVIRNEGHPLLWYLWLKLFLALDLPYKHLFITSILPNFIAVTLFMYKAPFKASIRFLFPLTYFIFYQYNIIARSYSLLFLLTVIVAILYPKKKACPYLFIFSLMLLGQVSAHSFILACMLFMMSVVKQSQNKEKYKIEAALFFIYAVVTVLMLLPDKNGAYINSYFNKKMYVMVNIFRQASVGLINCADFLPPNLPLSLIGIAYFIIIAIQLLKVYKEKFVFLVCPVMLFNFIVPFHSWHAGILVISVLLLFWLWPQDKLPPLLSLLIKLFFAVQILWSAYALVLDAKARYSAAVSLYEFMQKQNISAKESAIMHYNAISVCPYFNDSSCSYWNWQKNGFIPQVFFDEKKMLNQKNIIINKETYNAYPQYLNELQKKGGYSLQIFQSSYFFAMYNSEELETFYLYYKGEENEK